VRKISLLGLIGVGSLLFTSAASATSLINPSEANIAGTVNVDNTGVHFSGLNIQSPNLGSFAGVTGVTLKDLIGAPQTGAINISQFGVFTVPSGNVSFDLTNIFAGVGSTAGCSSDTVGNSCTPTNSPFTLTQAAPGQVTISLSLSGVAYTGDAASGVSSAPFSFTSQNTAPGTITGILAEVAAAGGFTNAFSATISTTSPAATPEPASYMLMGAGLAAAGMIFRRRKSQS
jgi:hypothetical protein